MHKPKIGSVTVGGGLSIRHSTTLADNIRNVLNNKKNKFTEAQIETFLKDFELIAAHTYTLQHETSEISDRLLWIDDVRSKLRGLLGSINKAENANSLHPGNHYSVEGRSDRIYFSEDLFALDRTLASSIGSDTANCVFTSAGALRTALMQLVAECHVLENNLHARRRLKRLAPKPRQAFADYLAIHWLQSFSKPPTASYSQNRKRNGHRASPFIQVLDIAIKHFEINHSEYEPHTLKSLVRVTEKSLDALRSQKTDVAPLKRRRAKARATDKTSP